MFKIFSKKTALYCAFLMIQNMHYALAQTTTSDFNTQKLEEPLGNISLQLDIPKAQTNKGPTLRVVQLDAALTENSKPLQHSLKWRIFHTETDKNGKLPLLASSSGGSGVFEFNPGSYLVHVAFGRASVTRRIIITKDKSHDKEPFILNAGGMVLNAISGNNVKIPSKKLKFAIYSDARAENGKRKLIAANIRTGMLIRLNDGTYHVVSDYGSLNATIRSDIRVKAGKLTEATIQHRAAELTFKLVSSNGGEAMADTAWSILTASGDPITQAVGAFPTIILAEGNYTTLARNNGEVYQREFNVKAGQNRDIEVLIVQKVQN